MRKLLISITAIIFILGFTGSALSADLKIGYVDTLKVFNEYQQTKDYDQVLADKQKKKEEESDNMIAQLKKLQDQYVLLSDAEKEKKKGEIDGKLKDLEAFRRQTIADLRKEQNDFMTEIAAEIDKVVKKQAKDGGYDFVLNGQAVLYGKEALDLTDSALKELNDNYKSKKK